MSAPVVHSRGIARSACLHKLRGSEPTQPNVDPAPLLVGHVADDFMEVVKAAYLDKSRVFVFESFSKA